MKSELVKVFDTMGVEYKAISPNKKIELIGGSTSGLLVENTVLCFSGEKYLGTVKKTSPQKERARAVKLVMDLFYALKEIKGQPTLKDLVKLAKRVKKD